MQGSSKCAAVFIGKNNLKQYVLRIARNSISENSKTDKDTKYRVESGD